jgi:hypothetical protein
MSFTDGYDFQTPDSMDGVERDRPPRYDPIYPPGDWGEGPPEMVFPRQDRDPYAPRPIPTDPDTIIGFRSPFYQDIFDPQGPGGPFQQFPPPPPGGGWDWPEIIGTVIGGALVAGTLFGLGDFAYHTFGDPDQPKPPPPMPIPNLMPIPVEGPYDLPPVPGLPAPIEPSQPGGFATPPPPPSPPYSLPEINNGVP